ncbi:acylphosphatase [Pleurocapsales cyanobacterium LEGE 06147]|nr:acylphosphatase [Pleurocapsales cyanobacterium LEGE 06147]
MSEDLAAKADYICVRIFVSGKVQGVGYRFSTRQQAQNLGINGWVRNLPDGRVEAVLAGDRPTVEQMIQWCRIGPAAAVVKNITVEEIKSRTIDGFTIK